MQRPDLAKTLKSISNNGKAGFYSGEIADAFIHSMNENDGFFSNEDFINYKARISEPIVGSYRDNLVFTAGPPSGGGVTLLTALNFLSFFKIEKDESNTFKTYHLLAEALRRGTTIDRIMLVILVFTKYQLMNFYQKIGLLS